MFQNMLLTALTPFDNKRKITKLANQSFTSMWPAKLQTTINNAEDITRTIKKKRKRVRTAFTTEQIQTLESAYCHRKYVDQQTKCELANSLNIDKKCIKIWFQNRRMREKRQLSESSSDSTTGEISASSYISNQASVTSSFPSTTDSEYSINKYPNLHTYYPNVLNNKPEIVSYPPQELNKLEMDFLSENNYCNVQNARIKHKRLLSNSSSDLNTKEISADAFFCNETASMISSSPRTSHSDYLANRYSSQYTSSPNILHDKPRELLSSSPQEPNQHEMIALHNYYSYNQLPINGVDKNAHNSYGYMYSSDISGFSCDNNKYPTNYYPVDINTYNKTSTEHNGDKPFAENFYFEQSTYCNLN